MLLAFLFFLCCFKVVSFISIIKNKVKYEKMEELTALIGVSFGKFIFILDKKNFSYFGD